MDLLHPESRACPGRTALPEDVLGDMIRARKRELDGGG